MANVAGKQSQQIIGDINITPLTDIFLVMLIIMMVVAPMMTKSRQDIRPPSILGGGALDQKWLTVEVSGEGHYYIDGQEIPADGLQGALAARAPMLTSKNLILRGDKTTKTQAIMRVFAAAEQTNFEVVTVAGEAQISSKQPELAPPVVAPSAPPVGAPAP